MPYATLLNLYNFIVAAVEYPVEAVDNLDEARLEIDLILEINSASELVNDLSLAVSDAIYWHTKVWHDRVCQNRVSIADLNGLYSDSMRHVVQSYNKVVDHAIYKED